MLCTTPTQIHDIEVYTQIGSIIPNANANVYTSNVMRYICTIRNEEYIYLMNGHNQFSQIYISNV